MSGSSRDAPAALRARLAAAFAAALVVCALDCGSRPPPRPPPPAALAQVPSIALVGARIIDGTGAPPVENATLIIEGERVRAVGPAVAVPPGARVVSLAGKTVLPGLVSDHSHVGVVDGLRVGPECATRENILRQLAQFEAYGVTSVTSLGLNGPIFYELQPDLHRGALAGADLFGADRGIGIPAGAPPVKAGPDQLYRVANPDEARAAVRETAGRHPDLVKLWVDDFHGSLPSKMSPEVYRAVIDEAHRLGLRVAAHVFYLDDAKHLVADGVDVLAHGVRDRPVDPEFIAAVKQHGTFYVPTLGLDEAFYIYAQAPAWTSSPFFRHAVQPALAAEIDDPAWRTKVLGDAKKLQADQQALAINLQNVKTLHDAGVAIGFGTDSGATPLRIPGFAEHHEIALLVRAGIAPLEALRMATSQAAKLLGLNDRGEIAAGKLADLLVVDGDPAVHIDDLSKIVAVWHRGKEVAGSVDAFRP